MLCVGVKTLKNKLSEYLRMVAAGETVLVTDRNRVIAELAPPREARAVGSDALFADAVRKGWVTPAAILPGTPPPRLPLDRLDNILGELDADRAER
jgi:antitoxin (DNA-binding transcriptional repressor) of toxin-antitoxin stability system